MVWKETLMHETSKDFDCTFNSRLFERDLYLHFKDQRRIFQVHQTFNHRFPKHFIFANFRCLRCGACCGDERIVDKEDIARWILDLDILEHVQCGEKISPDRYLLRCADLIGLEPCEKCSAEIVADSSSGRCPFIRKVRNRIYYTCRIHGNTPEECSGFLCEKSVPIAHLNWSNVEELIQSIGLNHYMSLAKKPRE